MFDAHATLNRLLWNASFCLALALAVVPIGAARAADLCADMNILVEQARSNFSNKTAGKTDAVIPPVLPGAENCAATRSLAGPKVYRCAWKFPYRAAGAYGTFDAFNQSLRECFGDRAQLTEDRRVNHPDSYDLRQYQLDQVDVTVSIKDKSALQRTYVFVRVQGGSLD